MIIGRSPLRISLGGGGTDLPSYYHEHGGFLIAAAIDKYVYVSMHQTQRTELLFRYSQIECVSDRADVRHPIIREALKLVDICERNLEVTSMADIPAGTGLGSSGSFTTCLLKVFHKFKKRVIQPQDLAEMACHIELDLLSEPIGKQDQFIAAFGGITAFDFARDGRVTTRSVELSDETLVLLEDNLLLFQTGFHRTARSVLEEQNVRTGRSDAEIVSNLHYVKDVGYRSLDALQAGDLPRLAELMNEHWQHKKKRSSIMSNGDIDQWYALGLANGAIGGKLVGAGGGGCLMFYTEQPTRLRRAMRDAGLMEIRFGFDFEGSKLLG